MSRSPSVWSLWLLRTVNAWETRQLVVFEPKWAQTTFYLSSGPEGGSRSPPRWLSVWWERRGGDGTGFLLLWLPPSPQKPGKQCPEQRSTHVWALSLSFSVFQIQTIPLQWDRLHLRMSRIEWNKQGSDISLLKVKQQQPNAMLFMFPLFGFLTLQKTWVK